MNFYFRHIRTAFSQCQFYDAYEANQWMKRKQKPNVARCAEK
jgi:hypothetical protein